MLKAILLFVKRAVIKCDDVLFQAVFLRTYVSIKNKLLKKTENNFFNGKKNVVLNEPVADMVLMQFNHGEHPECAAYDLAVRYLTIENYYGKNDFGFELYKKMHTVGGNYGPNNDAEKYYTEMRKRKKLSQYGKVGEYHSIEQFSKLIESYDRNGYDESSLIMADKSLLSMNGSHRMSLAVYRGQDFIQTDVRDLLFKRRFTKNWFWENNFTRNEIKTIEEKLTEIFENSRKRIGYYYCIIYPPAYKYFDEITDDLRLINSEVRVVDYSDFYWCKNDFLGFVRSIYAFDSITTENLKRKFHYILKASEYVNGKLPFRVVRLQIDNPMYHLKKDNGMPESEVMMQLKQAIRFRYRDREEKFTKHYVVGYEHDVIIHSTDNYLSNHAFKYIFNMDRNLTELFGLLREMRYALIQTSVDKIPQEFPRSFYLHEDVDIFVQKEDLNSIVEKTVSFCEDKYKHNWISISVSDSIYGKKVWVKLRNVMLVMFDFITQMPRLNDTYIEDCISRCNCREYNSVKLEDELLIRLSVYFGHSSKEWHAQFIREHRDSIIFKKNAYTEPEKMKAFLDQFLEEDRA